MNASDCTFTELLAEVDEAQTSFHREKATASHRQSWRTCWDWAGPEVGGFCEVHTPIVETEDGRQLYAYMERCRLIEEKPDGRWLAEIQMGEVHGNPWPKDGTRLMLDVLDIWAPTRDLRDARGGTPKKGEKSDDRTDA